MSIRKGIKFYRQFIRPGDLCFDIGAHLGNRSLAWSRLGARVVAVEPQQHCINILRLWQKASPNIILLQQAVGASTGTHSMLISRRTPTATTLSREWTMLVQQDGQFGGVSWDEEVSVSVTTLDVLIARYGEPVFCKIDVEGFELEVLQGLSHPLHFLSFEFLPQTMEVTRRCIQRLEALGRYEFNWSFEETLQLGEISWISADEMVSRLHLLPPSQCYADIYARRVG